MSLILIVEDNDKNLKLVRDVLQVKGYTTLEAGTAEDGIKLAGEHKPDLILMDIHLPGMNGIDALGVLRADATTAAIPLAVATNTLKPESFVRIRAFEQSGQRWHEIRLAQAPAVFTGTHERGTSHYELLRAFASDGSLDAADRALEARGYRTHEFGDSMLVATTRMHRRVENRAAATLAA